jgi:hypothetical protein
MFNGQVPLNISEFREEWCLEGRTFIVGVNKITSACTVNTHNIWKVNKALVYSLCTMPYSTQFAVFILHVLPLAPLLIKSS